jgi:high-affinity iron transporter
MLQAISITMREGFEAALVIGIMMTYAAKTGRDYLKRPIIWGTAMAAVASVAIAFTLSALGVDSENAAVEGVLYLIASAFIFSMVVWMWRTGGDLRTTVAENVDRAHANATAGGLGVAAVAFFMVAREGVETVLFLAANTLDQGFVPTMIGATLGLAVAAGLGLAIYYGAARIDLKTFFAATSIALLLLAARFLGIGILELGEAGVLALPEVVEEGLELLEKGVLATLVNVAVIALPISAIGWSLFRHRRPAHPAT